jgi:hypothetical protein
MKDGTTADKPADPAAATTATAQVANEHRAQAEAIDVQAKTKS